MRRQQCRSTNYTMCKFCIYTLECFCFSCYGRQLAGNLSSYLFTVRTLSSFEAAVVRPSLTFSRLSASLNIFSRVYLGITSSSLSSSKEIGSFFRVVKDTPNVSSGCSFVSASIPSPATSFSDGP